MASSSTTFRSVGSSPSCWCAIEIMGYDITSYPIQLDPFFDPPPCQSCPVSITPSPHPPSPSPEVPMVKGNGVIPNEQLCWILTGGEVRVKKNG